MAKRPLVTHTFRCVECDALCLNLAEGHAEHKTVMLPRIPKNDDKLDKMLAAKINNESYRYVSCENKTIVLKRYGMSESEFIENAEEIPLLKNSKKEN